MNKLLPIYFPARTLLLATLETLPAVALLLWSVPGAHEQAWVWLWDQNGFLRIGAVATTFVFCMYYYDLYESYTLKSIRVALARLPEVLGTVCLALAGLYFLVPEVRLRLAVVLLAVAALGLGVAIARQTYFVLARSAHLSQNYVVVGKDRLAIELVKVIESRPELGIRVTHIAPKASDAASIIASTASDPTVPLFAGEIDGVILTADRTRGWSQSAPKNESRQNSQVLDGESLYEALTGKAWLESPDPVGIRKERVTAASCFWTAGAQIVSAICALFALLFLSPLMATIGMVIWIDSRGPVIFRQQRVGQNGRPFLLYKFRSMRNGNHGPFRPAQKNDRRFTRVGRWLRLTRLDELPQLWNIVRGDMAFWGPRPFAWEEERKWAIEIPRYTERWKVKPGVTGWAQVRRGYCSTREDNIDKLSYDLFYVKNQSFGLNLLILFETTKILLKGRGAR